MGIQMAIELWESNLSHFLWCRGMLHCSYRKRIDMYSFCPGLEFPLVMQEEKVTVSVLNFLFFYSGDKGNDARPPAIQTVNLEKFYDPVLGVI